MYSSSLLLLLLLLLLPLLRLAATAASAACCEYEISATECNKSAPHTCVNKGSPRPSPARCLLLLLLLLLRLAAAACCEYEINASEHNKSAPHTYVNKGSPRPSLARLLRNSLPPSLPSSTSTGKKNGVGRAPTAEGIYGTTRDTTTRTAESCVRGGGIDPTHPYTKVLGLLYPHLSATITSSRHLYKWGGRAAVSTFWGK